MKAFHLTNNLFNKFDANYCRCTCFGAGFYFYTQEHNNDNAKYQLSCDVTLKHPMTIGKNIITNEQWDAVRQYLINTIKEATGKVVMFPTFGGDDIVSYKYFCQLLEDWIEPDWNIIFKDFTAITGCDGYQQDDFIISFNSDNIIINN